MRTLALTVALVFSYRALGLAYAEGVVSPPPTAATAIQDPNTGQDPDIGIVTKKADYTHVLLDLAPRVSAGLDLANDTDVTHTVMALLRLTLPTPPPHDRVVVDVVSIQSRDEYGAPVWKGVKKVVKVEFHYSKAAATLQRSEATAQEFQSVVDQYQRN